MPVPLDSPSSPANGFQAAFVALWKDGVGGRGIRLSASLILILSLLIAVFYWRLPPQIPLFYSRPWGAAQLVPSAFLLMLVPFMFLLVVTNCIIAARFFPDEPLLARMLSWASALTVLLVDITVIRVILLIG